MQKLKLLPQLLLLVIAASAEAQDGRSCLEQSTQLKAQNRAAFLTACLAQASSPASALAAAQQEKAQRCVENAKNLALSWDAMNEHIKTCLIRNEAAEVAAGIAALHEPPTLASTARTNLAHP